MLILVPIFISQVPAILLSIFLLLLTPRMTSALHRVWDEWRQARIGSLPGVCTQEALAQKKKTHDASYRWGRLCRFQVEMVRKGREERDSPDAKANWRDYTNRWVTPGPRWVFNLLLARLLACSLSPLVVPTGLVIGSQQGRRGFNWADLLICPYVPQQNTFLIPGWGKKNVYESSKNLWFDLTSSHHDYDWFIKLTLSKADWKAADAGGSGLGKASADKRQWSRWWWTCLQLLIISPSTSGDAFYKQLLTVLI